MQQHNVFCRECKQKRLLLAHLALLVARLSWQKLNVQLLIEKKRKRERNTVGEYATRRENLSLETAIEVHAREFEGYLRMPRSTFRKLLLLVENGLQRNERMGRLAKRPVVIPELRLAIFLRMMAGGSPRDIASTFRVSRGTAYQIFHQTRSVLNAKLTFPGLPQSFDSLKKIANNFQLSRKMPNPIPGCVGTLDGITIKIKYPGKEEHPAGFWCRKGFPAIPVQALCDSKYRFLCFSAKCRGSTQDSLAHAVSALGKYLEAQGLRTEFWIAGDEAYVCSLSLITPVPGTQATDEEDASNFFHSSTRMYIEQAFGMLKRKWPILKDLEYSVYRCNEIIGVSMKLHNFVIDHGRREFWSELSDEQRRMIRDSEKWYTERRESQARGVLEGPTSKRNSLIEIIRQTGRTRPPVPPVHVPQHLNVPATVSSAIMRES